MAIKALEQKPILDKPHIKGDYYDGFKNGLRTAEWRYNKIRAEIEQMDFNFGDFYDHTNTIREMVLAVIDKYKTGSEVKE